MKLVRLLPTLLALLPAALLAAATSKNCGCACCQGKEVCCCHAKDTATTASKSADDQAAPADAKRYPLKGVIVAVRPADHELLVKHEDIPGLMRAMTMPFKVASAALEAVKQGDRITATLVERDGDFWLEDIHVAAATAAKP